MDGAPVPADARRRLTPEATQATQATHPTRLERSMPSHSAWVLVATSMWGGSTEVIGVFADEDELREAAAEWRELPTVRSRDGLSAQHWCGRRLVSESSP